VSFRERLAGDPRWHEDSRTVHIVVRAKPKQVG
jgi:hypothetical protein